MLLTDEEIQVIFDRAKRTPTAPVDCYICRKNLAKAQLKKVVEWGNEDCPHNTPSGRVKFARECHLCWQTLLKEVGDE